ncbi:MAG: hypothetical protein HC913_03725 [Microscillaceae bacterium]|nr:hypothetical protein [Microscillaceae bacterium]
MSVAQLDAVIHYYDSLVICHDILSGYPDRLTSAKHRFTRDIQITAGYAHSGFPMMTQWDLVNPVIDQIDIWGNGHELGHNYQRQAFRSRFGVEVTVNLFTVHSFERMFPHHLDRLDNVYETVCNKFLNGSLDYDREQDVFQRLIFCCKFACMPGGSLSKNYTQSTVTFRLRKRRKNAARTKQSSISFIRKYVRFRELILPNISMPGNCHCLPKPGRK